MWIMVFNMVICLMIHLVHNFVMHVSFKYHGPFKTSYCIHWLMFHGALIVHLFKFHSSHSKSMIHSFQGRFKLGFGGKSFNLKIKHFALNQKELFPFKIVHFIYKYQLQDSYKKITKKLTLTYN